MTTAQDALFGGYESVVDLDYHARSFPKCTAEGRRITHGAGTDCRAWWPACHEHELGDPKVSADAMRCKP